MGSVVGDWDDDRYSVIGDKEDVGFLDFKDDKSFLGSDEIDVGPVVISKPFPFIGDKPQSALVGKRTVDLITIKNTTTEPMDLWGVKIYSSTHVDAFYFSLTEPPSATFDDESSGYFFETTALEDRIIQAGQTLNIWFSCKPKDLGLHNAIVHFDVGDDRVERVVFLLADDMLSQSLAGNKPYSKESRRKHFNMERYVPAARIPRAVKHEFKYSLSQFHVPKNVRELVANQQCPEVLTEGLTMKNYCLYFTALLQLEELQMEEDVKAYDMYNVSLRRRGSQYFALEVPGLAEKRPSLVSGDLIYVKLGADNPYQGHIFKVEADEVILKFDPLFLHNHHDSNQYDVRFSSNRLNMRRKYQAVEAAEKLSGNLLFPSQSFKRSLIKTPPILHLNQSLNEEQKSSVDTILHCRGSPPYIIHGPPGTGKTITLVEAILQLYLNRKDSRVLVCASSNSAADHIFEKLTVRVQENEIFRLNAISRPYEDVQPDIIRYCFFDDSGFKCPPLKALKRYRIIASTYMSASLLYAEGVNRGHFSHIFLDEAGQSSEPETMAPISNLANKETVVVLAGDPMQLGPVIYSKDADNFGLGKSYLERLFECELYDGGDRNFVMKLVRNYRCHPAILELPSNLFYKGELIACKQEDSELPVYEWAELPNKTFPVMFVGIQGCDEREERNPSWFNRIEVSKVVEIIRKLIDDAGMSEEDIGVITPYRQQVLKMKKALESLEFSGIKVGSVEQFQGQERQIIIISTVRSTVKHEDFDRKHNLGFLTNSRRFNVAITRARSLLIIVGNPHIICKDPYWHKLLKRCTENGSYVGCPLPEVEIENYGDEADADEWDQEIPKPFIDEGEWTDDVPWSHTAEGEWGEETRRTVSDEGGWGEESSKAQNILKPVPDEGGWGNDIPYSSAAGGEWGQQTPEPAADEGGWGDDIPCPSATGGEWGQQTLEPAADEGGWGDDIPCPSAAGGEWGQQTPEPAADEGGWGVESFKGQETLNPIPDRGRRSDKSFKVQHIRRPVNDEDEWDDRSSNNQETRKPGKWRYQSYKAREPPKTVSNEPEWSDWH